MAIAIVSAGCAAPVRVEIKRAASPVVASSSPTVTVEASPTVAAVAETPVADPKPVASVIAGDVALLRTPPPIELAIPSISLTTAVEEVPSIVGEDGWGWALPEWTAAHHLGTANPGEPGNIVISGHVTVRGEAAVFNQLLAVQVGDEIVLASARGQFRYIVESVTIVPENDLSVFLQVPYEQLTLMTCVPDGEFKHRLVVRAKPV